MEIRIGSKGTEISFPAGYMNRATRRRYAKLARKGEPSLLAKMKAHAQ